MEEEKEEFICEFCEHTEKDFNSCAACGESCIEYNEDENER